MRYLTGDDVLAAVQHTDPVTVVSDTLLLHAEGRTTLPEEACLGWQTTGGATARSLVLPGALWGAEPALGVKIINSSLANPDRGIPRANGLIVLFDRETARPVAIMHAAHLSALRTSAYTALSVRLLGPPAPAKIAVIGAGALGQAHLRLLAPRCPGAWFAVHDHLPHRRDELVSTMTAEGLPCRPAHTAQDAVRDAGIVITTTTTTTGYLPYGWLAPGALVAHVSLDDVLPDVVKLADLVIVDDWPLVAADGKRLAGRMYRSGELLGPGGETYDVAAPTARRVDATLADIVSGRHPGRRSPDQIVLSNPFGMGILDVAMGAEVLRVAVGLGLGTLLPS